MFAFFLAYLKNGSGPSAPDYTAAEILIDCNKKGRKEYLPFFAVQAQKSRRPSNKTTI